MTSMTSDAVLLAMQAPQGIPRSVLVETTTDPLLPAQKVEQMLGHFFEGIYDLSAEGHLARYLKVILGDSGCGQLRKKYTYHHLSQVLMTTYFYDIDRFYSDLFGVRRVVSERLDIDPYEGTATEEEWEALMAADAAYRGRAEQFSRSIAWAGTPTGISIAASAILGVPVQVYETYEYLDATEDYAPADLIDINTYGDIEGTFYGDLDGMPYGQVESDSPYRGRLSTSRGEFIVRPLRPITDEEKYELIRTISRIKPAEALMTIDSRGIDIHERVPALRAAADSSYWSVRSAVAASDTDAQYYDRYDGGNPVHQPRPAFSGYQSEAWSYNNDVVSISSHAEDSDGAVIIDANFQRRTNPTTGQVFEYSPDRALASTVSILLGRSVSDGVLSVSPVERSAAS